MYGREAPCNEMVEEAAEHGPSAHLVARRWLEAAERLRLRSQVRLRRRREPPSKALDFSSDPGASLRHALPPPQGSRPLQRRQHPPVEKLDCPPEPVYKPRTAVGRAGARHPASLPSCPTRRAARARPALEFVDPAAGGRRTREDHRAAIKSLREDAFIARNWPAAGRADALV